MEILVKPHIDEPWITEDLGEGGVTSGHETCAIHIWHRKEEVTGHVIYKTTFFLLIWRVMRRVWRGCERPDIVWSQSSLSFLLPPPAMAGPRFTKISDKIPLEVCKDLSIERICIALPRCSLGEKPLERVSQCHLVGGLWGGQACLTWEGRSQPLEIPKLQVFSGGHHILPWAPIKMSSWERTNRPIQTLPAGTEGVAYGRHLFVRLCCRGGLSWNLHRLFCYHPAMKSFVLDVWSEGHQQWHQLGTC